MDKQLRAPFNLYFFETDKLCGRRRGSVGPVATIPVEHLGWIPSDEESSTKPLSRVDSEAPTETELPRRIDFKYIDIEKDFEQGSQGDSRQVTQSEHVETIEVPLAMYADEARAVTQRELYRAQIEGEDEAIQLDWSYIWVKPGDTLLVENGSGFTIRFFVKTIKPAIDVIDVRGVAEDIDLFDPNVSTSGGGSLTPPPVPIPGMTIVSFGDFTAWRTEDEGVPGYYVWVVKRTGDGAFTSAVLVKVIEGVPDTVATFAKEATAGTVDKARRRGRYFRRRHDEDLHGERIDGRAHLYGARLRKRRDRDVLELRRRSCRAGCRTSTLYYVKKLRRRTRSSSRSPLAARRSTSRRRALAPTPSSASSTQTFTARRPR
jgi:hypothetical protein